MNPDKGEGVRIGVLVSGHGRGSNMQALIDGCADGRVSGVVALVVGTRADTPALERARAAGVETVVVSPRKHPEESGYGAALLRVLRRREVDLLCLAGFMRRLPPDVVSEYAGRIMNVHPALLPLFGGKGMYGINVHRAVLESGMKVSGCTVHFADEDYDSGPIILQTVVPVEDDDTPETLAARILPHEHQTYVEAVGLFSRDRLQIDGRRVRVRPPA